MESLDERFHYIYNYYYPLLYSIARNKGVPTADRQDVIQDAILKFFRYSGKKISAMGKDDVRLLMSTIVHNCSVDYKRREERRLLSQSYSLDTINTIRNREASHTDILREIIIREEYEEVLAILKGMKKAWRDVMVLYLIEERPMKEVCQILNIKEDACRMRLMRARAYIREQVKEKENPRMQSFREVSLE